MRSGEVRVVRRSSFMCHVKGGNDCPADLVGDVWSGEEGREGRLCSVATQCSPMGFV